MSYKPKGKAELPIAILKGLFALLKYFFRCIKK